MRTDYVYILDSQAHTRFPTPSNLPDVLSNLYYNEILFVLLDSAGSRSGGGSRESDSRRSFASAGAQAIGGGGSPQVTAMNLNLEGACEHSVKMVL